MFKTYFLVFVSVLFLRTSKARYCDPQRHSHRIYNINRNLYIDQGNKVLLNYNLDTKQFNYYKMEDIYGTSK